MKKIQQCSIQSLHPTQITIGLIEVSDKCLRLAALKEKQKQSFVSESSVPAVLGPLGKLYITDHHHLILAAWHMNVEKAHFLVEADLSKLKIKKFWEEMVKNHWAHPVDHMGKVCPVTGIPSHVNGLRDDVYRSLARRVRDHRGYEKTPTAFAEFRWADFFRERIAIGPERNDFDAAVQKATKLAKSSKCRGLPGYCG